MTLQSRGPGFFLPKLEILGVIPGPTLWSHGGSILYSRLEFSDHLGLQDPERWALHAFEWEGLPWPERTNSRRDGISRGVGAAAASSIPLELALGL